MLLYLDEIAAAYRTMVEVAWTIRKRFYLHKKVFTFLDTVRLVAILHYRITLDCSVQVPDGKEPKHLIRLKKNLLNFLA